MPYLYGTHIYDGREHKVYELQEPVRIDDGAHVIYMRHPAEDAYGIYVDDKLAGVAWPTEGAETQKGA